MRLLSRKINTWGKYMEIHPKLYPPTNIEMKIWKNFFTGLLQTRNSINKINKYYEEFSNVNKFLTTIKFYSKIRNHVHRKNIYNFLGNFKYSFCHTFLTVLLQEMDCLSSKSSASVSIIKIQ